MKTLLTALLFAASMFSAETPKVTPPKVDAPKLTEVQALNYKILILTEEKIMIKIQAEANAALQAARAAEGLDAKTIAFKHEVCDPLKIAIGECTIDPVTHEVRKAEPQKGK